MIARLLRHWYVALPILALTIGLATLVERSAGSYEASGVAILASAQVDPARSVLQGIDMTSLISGADAPTTRRSVAREGGSRNYLVLPGSPRQIQVVVNDNVPFSTATATTELVLRHLERAVERQQDRSGRSFEERVRPRMIIEVPTEGSVRTIIDTTDSGISSPSAIGSMILRDPLEEGDSSLGLMESQVILLSTIGSDGQRRRISQILGDDMAFSVAAYDRHSPGMLQLTIVGPDPERTIAAFHPLVAAVSDVLESRQDTAAIPISQRLLLEVLAEPRTATDLNEGTNPLTLLMIALGVALATASTAFLDHRDAVPAEQSPDDESDRASAPASTEPPNGSTDTAAS